MHSNINEVPAHVRASWSPEELAYYEAAYDRPRLGTEWLTAHRKIEMTVADTELRLFFLGYWPDEALKTLEGFKRDHYDAKPDKGLHALSKITDRLTRYYPGLFKNLDCRTAPLSDALETHPHLQRIWHAYIELKASYWNKLCAADELTAEIEPAKLRHEKRHELYRLAFGAVYLRLKELLDTLVLMSR